LQGEFTTLYIRRRATSTVTLLAILFLGGTGTASAQDALAPAQAAFYSARYEQAAALTLDQCAAGRFEACELRTSALHFEIKRALGDAKDKNKALKECAKCQGLLDAFLVDIARGQTAARAVLAAQPADPTALFFLGKLDLNYVWLHLGTLGRKTGWDEYWEARKSVEAVLKTDPQHVRAKVARAWIDYIVDTRMPRGTRWVLGGGNKKRALSALHEAAKADTDFYTAAEAKFALWDIQVREKNFKEAVVVARDLVKDFPTNTDLPKFLQEHDPTFKAGG
jgi:tetratricopeptide (TPR) repeat protein